MRAFFHRPETRGLAFGVLPPAALVARFCLDSRDRPRGAHCEEDRSCGTLAQNQSCGRSRPPPQPQTRAPAADVPSSRPKKSTRDDFVEGDRVVIFIKGTVNQPCCRFSRQFVSILRQTDKHLLSDSDTPEGNKNRGDAGEFAAYDVLDPELQWLREELKQTWPTFPQLYVEGECVGGLDVVRKLALDHRLHPVLHSPTALAEFLEERELETALLENDQTAK
eukprot:g15678.t1